MSTNSISHNEVIEKSKTLPNSLKTVEKILATIDDPDANLSVLVRHVQQDPIISLKVLSQANSASKNRQHITITDIHKAISMLGMSSVREIAILGSFVDFANSTDSAELSVSFWEHSIAVGICCKELACYTGKPLLSDTALVCGLLHDIGQLWLYCNKGEDFHKVWHKALTQDLGVEMAEENCFGVDHSTIGCWLAEHWSLPPSIVKAIRYHHCPNSDLSEPLVSLIHVAEVFANALDLTGRIENRVTHISHAALHKMGLIIDDDIRLLFGRIDVRTRNAISLFHSINSN